MYRVEYSLALKNWYIVNQVTGQIHSAWKSRYTAIILTKDLNTGARMYPVASKVRH